ncbi:MAG: type II CRISPR-associated endonuclease Cas1 [Bacilli bacterium]
MSFRTVVVDSHSKLEYSLEYLIYRTIDTTKRILLNEIHTLIISSTAVSITTSLLSELSKRKIKVIFCDEKKNPISELVPFYCSYNSSKKIMEQSKWDDCVKDLIWQRIVIEKILNQAKSLFRKNKLESYNQLIEYSQNVELGDKTNREGHSAKVYFNNIYYKGFSREQDCEINSYLNYGYTILLSHFNRVIVSFGYITQLGIHHINEFNQFNLSCDLMEPFRFIIDEEVEKLDKENWKEELASILSKEVTIDGKNQTLNNAISIYCLSVFQAIKNNDPSLIKFIQNDI